MAAVDILYIDITRRWTGAVVDSREAGNSHTYTHIKACMYNTPLKTRQHVEDKVRHPSDSETQSWAWR